MTSNNARSGDPAVVAVEAEGGMVIDDPDQPEDIESYASLTFTTSDGRRITLDKGDVIIDAQGLYIGRVHSLRHLGGMDGWGYAVYVEYPEEDNEREFGRSEGTKLERVAGWFEDRARTTAR